MRRNTPVALKSNARNLRNEQTFPERLLWSKLKQLKEVGFHFRRQYPIHRFIADFACVERQLIIELDRRFPH